MQTKKRQNIAEQNDAIVAWTIWQCVIENSKGAQRHGEKQREYGVKHKCVRYANWNGSDLNAIIDDGTGAIYYNSVSPWGEEFFLF